MNRLIFIFLIYSNFLYTQTIKIDTNSILIGEQISLIISNELKNTTFWPAYKDTIVTGVEIINISQPDTINNIISQEIIITSWDSGKYYIPAIEFSENSRSKTILLNVNSIIIEDGKDITDIKEPMKAPLSWMEIWPWIVIIIIIICIIYIIRKYFIKKEKPEIQSQNKKIIPTHIIALEELKNLEKKELWQKGKIKEYHSSISEIIRRYIENHFMFIALELTTEEILSKLKNQINTDLLNKLRIILQRSDLAKFAKSKPIKEENIESLEIANYFIISTKENNIYE